MLAVESFSGIIWMDEVLSYEPVSQSPRQFTEHFKLYGTLMDVFDDYDRVGMLEATQLLGGFILSSVGGPYESSRRTDIIRSTFITPQFHQIKDPTGVEYFTIDLASKPLTEKIGTFFAASPKGCLEILPDKVIPLQPSVMRTLRKFAERYVIVDS